MLMCPLLGLVACRAAGALVITFLAQQPAKHHVGPAPVRLLLWALPVKLVCWRCMRRIPDTGAWRRGASWAAAVTTPAAAATTPTAAPQQQQQRQQPALQFDVDGSIAAAGARMLRTMSTPDMASQLVRASTSIPPPCKLQRGGQYPVSCMCSSRCLAGAGRAAGAAAAQHGKLHVQRRGHPRPGEGFWLSLKLSAHEGAALLQQKSTL